MKRRGFTLVEAAVASLVTGILLVAAMRATSSAVRLRATASNRITAQKLADGLMNDILALPYQEPSGGTVAFGIETGESSTSKAAWDDVDDFNGWSESPPQDRTGSAISELSGWKRAVKVERVAVSDAATVSSSETGLKRITVTVTKNSVLYCTRVAIKGAAQ